MAIFNQNKTQTHPKWMGWLALCILFCGFVFASIGQIHDVIARVRLERYGIFAGGTALRSEYRSGRGGGYYVHYVFKYKQVTYQSERLVKESWIQATKLPAPIRVQFLPDNPDSNWLPGTDPNPLWLDVLGAIFFSAGAIGMGVGGLVMVRAHLISRKSDHFDMRSLQLPAYPKGWH